LDIEADRALGPGRIGFATAAVGYPGRMDPHTVARKLLRSAGGTYAAEAGIRMKNTPMPLFELLVLCMLASKPIDAAIAMRAARELFGSGVRTPQTVLAAERREVIAAFGRARYVRYDESSATRLVDLATAVGDRYRGDLRRLADRADGDVGTAARLLQQFTGIGATGAGIYLREVQDVWTWVRPYFDDRALTAARRLGLPTDPVELAALAPRRTAGLAAALVRAHLDESVYDRIAG